ncbi:MAG: hypothetical protein IJR97_11485 [Clostridia bacterium]|nr:hypothetical protein [Clostridia bacterium]
MKKKLAMTVVIICLCLCGSAHAGHGEGYPIGVILTKNAKEASAVVFLDEDLTALSGIAYDAANVISDKGSVIGSGACMAANGHWEHLDRGTVVFLDMDDGAVKEFDLDRVNFTGLRADGEWIYVNSNLNWEFFFDRVNVNTGEIQSAVITDRMIYSFTACDDVIYAVAEGSADQPMALYRYSFITDEWDRLCALPDDECLGYTDIECLGDRICAVVDDVLYIYSLPDHILTDLEIGASPASGLCVVSGDVYVVISDPAAGSDDSVVIKADLESGGMETVGTYDGTIIQIRFAGDDVYIMDYDALKKTRIEDGEFVTVSRYVFDTEYDYCGGFFVR